MIRASDQSEYELYGEVIGNIWMPAAECTKDFRVRFSRDGVPFGRQADRLREVLLHVTNDGDFQSCAINFAVLRVRHHSKTGTVRERSWVLRGKGENADCFVKGQNE